MKRITFLLLITLFANVLQAQITLEKTYNNSASTAWIDGEGYKYYEMDALNNQCLIYNLNHSLYATINLSVPSGQYLYDLKYITNHTFDTDDAIELCYTYYLYNEADEYYTYTTKIINQNGSTILTIDGASYVNIINVSEEESDLKFIAYVYDYSVTPYTIQTRIYDLTDNSTSSIAPINPIISSAYPVPANNEIHIPIALNNHNSGKINVFSIEGKKMGSYHISDDKKIYNLNTQSFLSGTYIYQTSADNRVINGSKFIVKH